MNKMVMIAYNEAIDVDVMEMVETCGLKNYTKIMGVFGKGEASGTHLGDDIWPGETISCILPVEIKKQKCFFPVSGKQEGNSPGRGSRRLSCHWRAIHKNEKMPFLPEGPAGRRALLR